MGHSILQKKPMRRQDRKLASEEVREILKTGEYGILATVTGDGKPYSIPLNYAWDEREEALYMHCSAEGGQKIDNIRFCPDVCFTIVARTELMPEKFATKYWSANVFGTVSVIEDGPKKQQGIEAILRKYAPDHVEKGLKYIEGAIRKIYVLKLDIHEVTGKARKL